MKDILTATLVLSGAFLMLTAAIGIVRLPDVLCRSHAVAKALTLGIVLMFFGVWAHLGERETAFKILLAILFQLATIPVASQLLNLLAWQKGLPRWGALPIDDHRATANRSPLPASEPPAS